MPQTQVVFYQEEDGSVPILEWFERLPEKALDKCRVKLERLRDLGHELRRPEADYLRDGIYELRARVGSVNYRMLYFFHENIAAVVSHGIMKEKRVPPKEIDRAIAAKKRFAEDPRRHTHQED
ncbi:MAG: type II toxin-antitoxin system RelE/ParE family toxin [Acetobacteraceae bacterium]|nr:type II toxin-antitoxin system RelE/ParE family toxin [Acetobacteraceae bacterium]